mmetsp:Transcript_12909/g.11431  ORF Transcript_12909/g.11431 Transcript_12909/m.11431 type:complete len:136 (-) Transcript_12909:31-438(-)
MEDKISFFNILAWIGIFSTIAFWPLIFIFHYTGIEIFELPHGINAAYMAINIVFGTLLLEYCWGRSTILLGPLLTNTSAILVVPISILVDSLWIGDSFSWMYFIGTGLILIGFLLIATKDYLNSRKNKTRDTSAG